MPPGEVRRISVVIANHNHARFVAEAVDSALALEWEDVEVVVVDDGSTDGSVDVLRAYTDRVRLSVTENRSQREAANRGFAMSTGDVVIFLDADDILPADLPAHLVRVWGPSVSKVQFQVQPIDTTGRPVARPYPRYRPVPSPGDIRRWVSSTSAYPTPPGSGNAYARWCLEPIFPLDASIGSAADSGCLAVAPFVGDVVSVPGVLVGYRQHPGQLSDLLADDRRFAREVGKARGRWRLAQSARGTPEEQIDEEPLLRSRELLQFRVAANRVTPGSAPVLAGGGPRRLWRDIARSPLQAGPEGVLQRLGVALWCTVLLLGPEAAVHPLLRWRYRRR